MIPLYRYESTVETDALLAAMWLRMRDAGDLERMYGRDNFTLSQMFESSKPPHELIFAVDAEGIWLAFWFDHFMAGAFMAGWIRVDRRATLAAMTVFRRIFRSALKAYHTVFTFTWQEEILPLHKAMGYRLLGVIPELFHGHTAYLEVAQDGSTETKRWHSSQPSEQQEVVVPPQAPPLGEQAPLLVREPPMPRLPLLLVGPQQVVLALLARLQAPAP